MTDGPREGLDFHVHTESLFYFCLLKALKIPLAVFPFPLAFVSKEIFNVGEGMGS